MVPHSSFLISFQLDKWILCTIRDTMSTLRANILHGKRLNQLTFQISPENVHTQKPKKRTKQK